MLVLDNRYLKRRVNRPLNTGVYIVFLCSSDDPIRFQHTWYRPSWSFFCAFLVKRYYNTHNILIQLVPRAFVVPSKGATALGLLYVQRKRHFPRKRDAWFCHRRSSTWGENFPPRQRQHPSFRCSILCSTAPRVREHQISRTFRYIVRQRPWGILLATKYIFSMEHYS